MRGTYVVSSLIGASLLIVSTANVAFAASMRIAPSSPTVAADGTITLQVQVSSTDQAMNAASGVIKFPPDLLQVSSLTKGGSVIGLWVQEPSFSNAAGTINFEGIALNPGYTGANGTVLTVTFHALAPGTAPLTLIGASILANDGNGTEILTSANPGTITVTEPAPAPKIPYTPTVKPVDTKKPVPVNTELPEPKVVPEIEVPAPMVPVQKVSIEKPFDPRGAIRWIGGESSLLLSFLILVFIILDGLVLYQYLRLRKREGGELEHAQVVTHRSFLQLRDDVDSFVDELEEESKKRTLSPIEHRFVKEMRSDLSSAEKFIVKELREAQKEIR